MMAARLAICLVAVLLVGTAEQEVRAQALGLAQQPEEAVVEPTPFAEAILETTHR